MTAYATPEHAANVYASQYDAGTPCTRYPYEGTRWHLGLAFIDVDGSHRATWQLLKPDGRGACYSLMLSDGIPYEELSSDRFSHSDRIALRDQCCHLERTRLGIA